MKRAFTLVELLVVIGIVAILMGVLIGTFSGSTESARAAKCQSNMRNLAMTVQTYCMANGRYPRATSVECYTGSGRKDTVTMPGWMSEKSQNNPYEKGADTRRKCFDGGAIWPKVERNGTAVYNVDRSTLICPSHERYAREKNLGEPLWSFAMSAYFDLGGSSGKPRSGEVRRRQDTFRRADRFLLFAELPYAQMKVGGSEIQSEATSGAALDPVLNYEGGEVIGFNHKDGKNVMGHVCFADGHVERLRAPNNKGNIQELTKWLCHPKDDTQGDFDVSFSGGVYKRDFTQATE